MLFNKKNPWRKKLHKIKQKSLKPGGGKRKQKRKGNQSTKSVQENKTSNIFPDHDLHHQISQSYIQKIISKLKD